MGRNPCCSKEGLNRGAWTAHEDKILREYISIHGEGKWRNLPKKAGLKRCGKSCRLRWLNYLRPDIKRGNISSDEEELIIRLHNLLGNRWSLIAGRLPGRTDNEIKNYWNTNLGKKVKNIPQKTKTFSPPSSPPKLSAQPNEKTTQNQKPQQLAPPSHVVRTKATKCSEVLFINSHLPHSHSSSMHLQKYKSEAEVEEEEEEAKQMCNQTEPGNYGFLSSFPGEEKELSTDLLIDDFNVGDICLSELLNSDFSNMCDFGYGSNNNDPEPLSPCSDQPHMFSDEILKDWTQSNFADDHETNVSNNLQSFTSFLESSEEMA